MSLKNFVKPGTEHEFLDTLEAAIYDKDEVAGKTVSAVIKAFFDAPVNARKKLQEARIKAFATTSDFDDLKTQTATIFQEVAEFDISWMESFQETPDSGKSTFEIATNTGAGSWAHVPEGAAPAIQKFTGTKVSVPYAKYGYALGWTMEMIQDKELGVMFERAREAQSKYYAKMRSLHMGLLNSSIVPDAGHTLYNTSGYSTELDKDIGTLNVAYTDMMAPTAGDSSSNTTGIAGLGLGEDLANAELLLYISPKKKSRINRALRETSAALQSNLSVEFNIRPIYTWSSDIPTNAGILVYPGRKIQRSTKMPPTAFDKQDNMSLTFFENWVTRIGAGVAERKQVRLVRFA